MKAQAFIDSRCARMYLRWTMNEIPKDLHFEGDKLIRGIEQLSKAVKSTLGPSGQTVLIESPHHTHGITVTKDGVTVAKAVDLLDPVENLAVRIMKEAADRTASEAGDGTTTSIVLAEALVRCGIKGLAGDTNKTEVLRDLVSLTKRVVEELGLRSRRLTKKHLKSVATISANNDKAIGKLIADVYAEVGKDGVVTVEKSMTSETGFNVTHGFKLDRGYSSELFVNDQSRDECVLEGCHVMVCDGEVNNILNIESVLGPIIREGKRLLIVAPCSSHVINTLAANVVKKGLKVCVVPPPNFGYKQHELMQDLAVSVGATYFSEKTGDDLSLMGFEDLGLADRVVVSRDSTVIVKGDKEDGIDGRIAELHEAHGLAKRKGDKEFINQRIAGLSGGIGVIEVGGHTDLEQKELYDRVDDAVCAVRAAMQDGVVAGGGVTLYNLSRWLSDDSGVAAEVLREALRAPLQQIMANCGEDFDYSMAPDGDGYNLKTGEYGNMIDMGVIDPTRVTKSALQNAVSVAVTILSTQAIITLARA
jgi:chaperonin GroEL